MILRDAAQGIDLEQPVTRTARDVEGLLVRRERLAMVAAEHEVVADLREDDPLEPPVPDGARAREPLLEELRDARLVAAGVPLDDAELVGVVALVAAVADLAGELDQGRKSPMTTFPP